MNFADILDIHDSYSAEGAHKDILGDGFLMETNPIYRNIKSFAIEIGCEFVEAYPDYLLLPFVELPKILAHRRIPYVPGARLMRQVEEGRPDVFTAQDLPIPESYHLHEAAHVIADHFLKNVQVKSAQDEILKAMLAESFANTVDALTCIKAVDEIHSYFIKQNCYMVPQKKVIKAMDALISKLGFRFVFMLTFFAYLQANFLAKPLSLKDIGDLATQYAPRVKIGTKLHKDIATVSELGEKLDPLFRVSTTGNFLKQQGFDGDIYDLLDFPFMKMFEGDQRLMSATDDLCAVVQAPRPI